MINMGSDHRCVMARFVIPSKEKKEDLAHRDKSKKGKMQGTCRKDAGDTR